MPQPRPRRHRRIETLAEAPPSLRTRRRRRERRPSRIRVGPADFEHALSDRGRRPTAPLARSPPERHPARGAARSRARRTRRFATMWLIASDPFASAKSRFFDTSSWRAFRRRHPNIEANSPVRQRRSGSKTDWPIGADRKPLGRSSRANGAQQVQRTAAAPRPVRKTIFASRLYLKDPAAPRRHRAVSKPWPRRRPRAHEATGRTGDPAVPPRPAVSIGSRRTVPVAARRRRGSETADRGAALARARKRGAKMERGPVSEQIQGAVALGRFQNPTECAYIRRLLCGQLLRAAVGEELRHRRSPSPNRKQRPASPSASTGRPGLAARRSAPARPPIKSPIAQPEMPERTHATANRRSAVSIGSRRTVPVAARRRRRIETADRKIFGRPCLRHC